MATDGERSPHDGERSASSTRPQRPKGDGGGRRPRINNTTLRQLAHQVAQGRKTSFWSPMEEDPITGYVAGWDSPEIGVQANFFVVVPTDKKDDEGYIIDQYLIPQAGTRIRLHPHSELDDEPAYEDMEKIISKFRNYVIHNVI